VWGEEDEMMETTWALLSSESEEVVRVNDQSCIEYSEGRISKGQTPVAGGD
jgi:hypothetical protein